MKVAHSSDVAKTAVNMEGAEGVAIQWLIGKDDEAENFAMRLFEVQPGGHTPLHTHPHEHEVFVLDGRGVVTDEGRRASHWSRGRYPRPGRLPAQLQEHGRDGPPLPLPDPHVGLLR